MSWGKDNNAQASASRVPPIRGRGEVSQKDDPGYNRDESYLIIAGVCQRARERCSNSSVFGPHAVAVLAQGKSRQAQPPSTVLTVRSTESGSWM